MNLLNETQNRIGSAGAALSPWLVAACVLASFAARAETAAAPSSAASPSSLGAPGADPSELPALRVLQAQAQPAQAIAPGFKDALGVSDDLQADVQADPDDDAPAPPPPPPPPTWRPRRRRRVVLPQREARTGGIFSFGFGGAQQYVSGAGHAGAFDADLRLGYGFSDRFQLLFDVGGTTPAQDQYQTISMWHLRMHGQTVLFGDRRGNGLNLNVGIGFGGVSTNGYDFNHDSSQVGVALGGGLSYEARVTPHFALAPEFFASWQQVPNYNGLDSDIAWTLGARLNFVWYSPF